MTIEIRKLVFWQQTPSMHQLGLMESLAEILPDRLTLVVAEDEDAERSNQGWTNGFPKGVHVVVGPDASGIANICNTFSDEECHHVFSGIRAYPLVRQGLATASRSHARLSLYLERPDCRKWYRRLLIPSRDFVLARQWRHRIHRVLAIGDLGWKYYRGIGFGEHQVREFGYFPKCDTETTYEASDERLLRIICVARQVSLKRIDLLLSVLACFPDAPWRLTVVGDGPLLRQNKELASSLGIASRVEWAGVLENASVQRCMRRSDLLVLPSEYDGWGAVINEALAQGTRVVASDACGASGALAESVGGQSFLTGNAMDLERVLDQQLHMGPQTPEMRKELIAWYLQTLSPDAGARYLVRILCSDACDVPWRGTSLAS